MRRPLALAWLLPLLLSLTGAASATGPNRVVELRLDDEIIHSISADYVANGIRYAEETNADAVLLRLHTPGGLNVSMREIVNSITNSRVPVIVYVTPTGARAASAGFFILMASDLAVMAPGTTTGAASPVAATGQELPETMKKKVFSDAAAFLRSYTGKRGRNPDVAELAVTEARSFTDQEALDEGLIDAVCESWEEIVEQFAGQPVQRFDGRTETLELAGAQVEIREMTARQRFLSRIIDPNIAFLLFVFGILGLYIEFNHPGLIVPGVGGGISLVLALFAFHLLPINYAAVLLIVLALALFILEAMYVSHGVLAAGGVAAMVLGAVMLVESPPIPELRVDWTLALGVAVPFAAITVLLLRLVLKSRRWRAATGREGLLDQKGEVRREIGDTRKGQILVAGELWQAIADKKIPVGQSVRVVGMEGLILRVEPLEPTSAASSTLGKE
ncbi:MAG: nodulation protein NfeD [Candidatus Acidoferrales bacterium]